ncbi:M48 family metallopeptidase [Sphingomonas sp. M1-B02]|uniref:M48 family metallopeptidase n=1 Tax=Sphingomonas sp. M1-B02 TaxID=3114300 RepID=UPI00223EE54A|nr:M48 family metallopeptidase [Sphingomonas sp. S6-11]UZK66242.1 M48 family metallopeptidase [Sphingomonas sp. S6-11]
MTAGAGAQSTEGNAQFEALRAADLKLATIGWRLATANAPLCERLEPGTGIQLHTLDQFDSATRAQAQTHFGFASPIAVEAIVSGSPAERAGLRADDSLIRVGSVDMRAIAGKAGTTERLVAAQLAIAALPTEASIAVEALRGGEAIRVTIEPVPACKSRFELEIINSFGASADGTMVQISSRFLDDYSDDQVAAVTAHEFAHNVLHHRDRLVARGVDYGLLSGFGANVKYFRQTEIQADLLSAYLLANAGYPPRASIDFWRKYGSDGLIGLFRSRSHPHWRDRIATLEAEIPKIEAQAARPIVPALIAERSQPLSGDWQSLLVRR